MSKKKITLIIITTIVLLTLGTLAAVGNYFFNYALVRPENGEVSGANRNVSSENTTQSKISNYEIQDQEQTNEWIKNTNKEKVTIKSDDGLLLDATKFFPSKDSHNWVIILHGYSSNQNIIQSIAMHYADFNYNSLTPDLRAHGQSEGKYIGMGWLDRKDVLKWINLITEKDSNAKIVIHGVSMGAATAMMVSSQQLPPNVKCIIADCGYTSVHDIFSSELKLRFGLPSFPILNAASLVSKVRAGYGFKEASALEQVKKSVRPILFIHGDADKFVPVSMAYTLYDAANCKKDLLIVPNADHAYARIVDPDAYYEKVQEFIKVNS